MGYGDCQKHGKSKYGHDDCECKSHYGKSDCGCSGGYKKHDCGCGSQYEKVKCGCAEIVYKKGTAKVSCHEKFPCVEGYWLVCREKSIENNYEESPCGDVDLHNPVVKCLVIEAKQYGKFVTLQILNVTDSCPILCTIVDNYSKDPCRKWKMIGAGGNAARHYDFKFGDIKCYEVKDFSYNFVQGASLVIDETSTQFQAATGCGNAWRICEHHYQEYVDKYPEGDCGSDH